MGILDLTGHGAAGLHAVIGPGGSGNAQQQGHESGGNAFHGGSGVVGALDAEQADQNQDNEGDDLDAGDHVLELSAGIHLDHVQGREADDQCDGDDADGGGGPAGEVSQVVTYGQGGNGDAYRVGGPEAGPGAKEGQEVPTGFPEVYYEQAILGVGCHQFGVTQVLGDHDEAADEESQNGHQRSTGRAGNITDRGEDTGAYGGADTQDDGAHQDQSTDQVLLAGYDDGGLCVF